MPSGRKLQSLTLCNRCERSEGMGISLVQFRELVEHYGAALASWPVEHRASAQALIESSDEAREILAEIAEMERALRSAPPMKAPAGLVDRIMTAARKTEKN